jgi:hypothetical protein
MPEVDVKGVVLDNVLPGEPGPHPPQVTRPGAAVLGQLETITRRRAPGFVGLDRPLKGIDDQVLAAPARFQGGVQFIIEALQKSDRPVTIVTVGSLRDVAAAFNRQPALFRQKVGRLLMLAGEAAMSGPDDDNVKRDPFAFAAIMRSGLPVYWVPRQDGGQGTTNANNAGNASVWMANMAETLGPVTGPPLQHLLNAITMLSRPSQAVQSLLNNVSSQRRTTVFAQSLELRGAAVLATIVDKTVAFDGTNAVLAPLSPSSARAVFGFSPVDVTVTTAGRVLSYTPGGDSRRVHRFRRLAEPATYARAMSLMAGSMLARLWAQ